MLLPIVADDGASEKDDDASILASKKPVMAQTTASLLGKIH